MSPARVAVGLVRDYLFVARRWVQAVAEIVDPAEFAAGAGRPVLLLPGIYEDWRFMLPVARRLADAGHPVHVLPGLGYNRATIASSAQLASAELERLDLHDVLIVAHSKGGLIGKLAMAQTAAAPRIRAMVAVNTPFIGSSLANLALRRELREFSPRLDVIRALGALEDVNARITSVYSSIDQVIPEGSALPGARNVELPFVGHFALLEDPRALAIIERAADAPAGTPESGPS